MLASIVLYSARLVSDFSERIAVISTRTLKQVNDKWTPIKENCSHFPEYRSYSANVNSLDRHDSVGEKERLKIEIKWYRKCGDSLAHLLKMWVKFNRTTQAKLKQAKCVSSVISSRSRRCVWFVIELHELKIKIMTSLVYCLSPGFNESISRAHVHPVDRMLFGGGFLHRRSF